MFAYLVLLSKKDPKDQKLKIEVPKEKVCLIRATYKNKKLSTRVSVDFVVILDADRLIKSVIPFLCIDNCR